jgi:hypothetical protein
MSSVWRADKRPHLCHVSFTPLPSAAPATQRLRFFQDIYPDRMGVERRTSDDRGRTGAFTLSAQTAEATLSYEVDGERQQYRDTFVTDGRHVKLDIDITRNTPYSTLGPMWISRFLPLPIYWHVFSTRSRAHVVLSDAKTGESLLETDGDAHQEKNWGKSEHVAGRVTLNLLLTGTGFPSGGWLWGQGFCRQQIGSFCFAGGDVAPGLRSLFLGVRTPGGRSWSFGPAGTVQLFGRGPFIGVDHDSRAGSIGLVVTDYLRGRRLRIRGRAPLDTFLGMAAPMPEGHREGCECYRRR